MIWKSALVCSAVFAAAMPLSAEESVKEKPSAPLVAADFECWEAGVTHVVGGWTRDENGSSWYFQVSEIIEAGEGKMRGHYRMVDELDLATYQRLRRMDDAAFLKAFGKLHEERGGEEYGYWKEVRDGAVVYRDDDPEEVGYHEFGIELPKDLAIGKEYRAFEREFRVAAYGKAIKGFWGACEAVRIDAVFEGEEIEGEEYPPYRVEQWYGRGLSLIHERAIELEETEDATGRVVAESRLQRVIRKKEQ